MPLKKGITVDDVIKAICHECCRSPIEPETAEGRACATSVSNAGYMILIKMGFVHEEIHKMLETAQKVRFAAFFKQQERKRKRRRS